MSSSCNLGLAIKIEWKACSVMSILSKIVEGLGISLQKSVFMLHNSSRRGLCRDSRSSAESKDFARTYTVTNWKENVGFGQDQG